MVGIIAPLLSAQGQQPAMIETYRLIADAWTHSAVRPLRGDLAVLDEGRWLFPGVAELADSVSQIRQQWGYK